MKTRDVEVEIYLLPKEHGGRSHAVHSGYRPQFYYEGHDYDADHEYPDGPVVELGTRARAYLRFLSPALHFGRIVEGMPFLLREGNRTVGYGSVKKLIDLQRSAARDSEGPGNPAT